MKKFPKPIEKVVERIKHFSKLSLQEKKGYCIVVFTDGVKTISILTQTW